MADFGLAKFTDDGVSHVSTGKLSRCEDFRRPEWSPGENRNRNHCVRYIQAAIVPARTLGQLESLCLSFPGDTSWTVNSLDLCLAE